MCFMSTSKTIHSIYIIKFGFIKWSRPFMLKVWAQHWQLEYHLEGRNEETQVPADLLCR